MLQYACICFCCCVKGYHTFSGLKQDPFIKSQLKKSKSGYSMTALSAQDFTRLKSRYWLTVFSSGTMGSLQAYSCCWQSTVPVVIGLKSLFPHWLSTGTSLSSWRLPPIFKKQWTPSSKPAMETLPGVKFLPFFESLLLGNISSLLRAHLITSGP